jgi:citrate lyase subunit beta/citryl-CoA lyase
VLYIEFMQVPRSKLFISGDCLDQLQDATLSEPDALSIDLEDGVAEPNKAHARECVSRFLRSHRLPCQVWVRINGIKSSDWVSDILALAGTHVDIINLPKVESASDVLVLEQLLSHIEAAEGIGRRIRIVPTIESARGLRLAGEIGAASSRVLALQLGAGDLTQSSGIDRFGTGLDFIRASISLAAAEAGVLAIDSTPHGMSDLAAFEADALKARSFGLRGKSCMLPSQVNLANRIFGDAHSAASLDRSDDLQERSLAIQC